VSDFWKENLFYKFGTVPIESNGSSSVRSIGVRLLQLNCLALV